jgi:hypothetical protein
MLAPDTVYPDAVQYVTFSPGGHLQASASVGTVGIRDPTSGALQWTYDVEEGFPIHVEFGRKGLRVFTASKTTYFKLGALEGRSVGEDHAFSWLRNIYRSLMNRSDG